MIILKSIKWADCFSYGPDNELSLVEDKVTQIVGVNGSGKSSIPLIIEEVLFNKNSKGVKKSEIPNRYRGGSYNIALEFTKDEDVYEVSVIRGKTLKVKLEQNGIDISSHTATNTYKQIESILGLDFKTCSQLVYQNTSSSLAFLTATDTERKKFLIDLLSLEKYLEFHELFKEKSREINIQKTSLNSRIETLNNWLAENNLEGMIVLPTINLEIDTEEEEREQARLTEKIKNILEIRKKISNNNLYKKQLDELDLSIYANVKESELIPYEDEVGRSASIKSQIQSLRKSKDKIVSLDDKCPTCEQEISSSFKDEMLQHIDIEEESLSSEYKRLQKVIADAKEINSLISAKSEAERNFQSLYRLVDQKLPSESPVEADLQKRLQVVKSEILRKKEEIEKNTKENLRRERNNTKIALIKEQSAETNRKLDKAKEDIEVIEALFSKVEILKKAFSTNGLIAYKIENSVKELEDLVNEYLVELSDGRFALAFVVERDKLNIQILDNGELITIEALSSGELARVNTSTLLAIRKLMSSLSKVHLNVLFLDEVINVLDESGKEKLVEVLLREEGLNTYLVSHQWTHPLLSKLNIVKENNISKVDNDGR